MNIIEKSKKGFPNFNFSNLLVLVFITYVIRVYYNVISLVWKHKSWLFLFWYISNEMFNQVNFSSFFFFF